MSTEWNRILERRTPVDLVWIVGMGRRYGLQLWFTLLTIAMWLATDPRWAFGFDTRLAVGAAQSWLAGGDPWSFAITGGANQYHFSGLPPTVVVYAALAPLGLAAGAVAGVAVSTVAAVLVLRRLNLPMWWLLFPPLNLGVWSANPDILMLALLLVGGGWLAPIVKVYAVIPMAGELRWRQLLGALAVTLVTVAIAPGLWLRWAAELPETTERLALEAQGGWSITGPAVIVVVVALVLIAWLRDLRTAAWLAVPAAWPSSELHYSTMAMPVMAPLLAVMLAVPRHLWPSFAVIAYAALLVWQSRTAPPRAPLRLRVAAGLREAGLMWLLRLIEPLSPRRDPPAPGRTP